MRWVLFVGRERALIRLLAAAEDARTGFARVVLVGGEAGIGKTALVGVAAAQSGLRIGWGTCVEAGRTPAFWPWSLALRGLLATLDPAEAAGLTDTDTTELARLLPELGTGGDPAGADAPLDADAARLHLFEALARFLERLARSHPAVVVLDDLQWADESSLQLLEFVTRPLRPVPLLVICAYRHDELTPETARSLGQVGVLGELVQLKGLTPDEVFALVSSTVGTGAATRWAAEVHRRTNGHPFLARHVAELLTDPAGPAGAVPAAAHELVSRRVERLSLPCRDLVRAAAVAGNELLPDVLAEVCAVDHARTTELIAEGVHAGVLVRSDGDRTFLAHDLFREAVYQRLAMAQRMALHQAIARALEHRHQRGSPVEPADLARHSAAAVPLDGAERAIRWARTAAAAERARLGFTEAAAHLARARRAVEDSGEAHVADVLVDLLVEEADARARGGDPPAARALLDDAAHRATAVDDGERLGQVALGVQRLGGRFSMPHDAIIEQLEAARTALEGTGTLLEAQVTAGLAQELSHSVPQHRPRARPLSERALALAREHDDPATLAACLLARHDVLWTPGRAAERIAVSSEIVALARRMGDAEQEADGLLLLATARLEDGSAAYRATLTEYFTLAESFGQPRYDYMVLTRRAALALIDGRLDEADEMFDEAGALGERISEPDTINVRTGQRIALARARGDPELLRTVADEAIRCWLGVPLHAHASAAGLLALAGEPGDLEAARRALDTVLATDRWREDRSYLWSVFMGGMATAAVRLGDLPLCAQLLEELRPFTGTGGIGGSTAAYFGSDAQWAGIVAGALGRTQEATRHLAEALAVHRRVGARALEAESHLELAAIGAGGDHAERAGRLAEELGLLGVRARLAAVRGAPPPAAGDGADAELCRDGELWRVRYRGASAHLRDSKGLTDLHTLLARPGMDVHVLELAGAAAVESDSGTLLDATARSAYRRRLTELDAELAGARAATDLGQEERLDAEREALLAELRRAAGLAGRTRGLGSSTAERARKTVTSRLREAIHRIDAVLPELGAHLDRSVITGTTCRYEPRAPVGWRL